MMENLHEWSWKMQGAREMLEHLRRQMKYNGAKIDLDPDRRFGNGKVYTEAIMDLALSSLDNTHKYLSDYKIGYRNFQHDKKGKLIKCEAYFL